MRILFLLSLLTIPVLSTSVYNPVIHGVLPGHQVQTKEYHIKHVKHVDEQGRVTYIHDTSDHRPDFCAIPGEDELCKQQIEAANNAPAVFDNDTIILNTPHDPNELNPGHDASINDAPASSQPDPHGDDTTLTLSNGDTVTIHNENGHPRNIQPDGPAPDNSHVININDDDGPAPDNGHIPNIHPHAHKETIKQEEEGPVDNIPHPRNINDGNQQDGPSTDNGHVRNINEQGQSIHKERIQQEEGPVDNIPHPRNINDGNGDIPDGNVSHPRNINDGQSISQKVQSNPIVKLQTAIKQASS